MYLIILSFAFTPLSFAGEWSRVSEDTIKFSGHIKSGELERFLFVSTDQDRNLIVDSKGGDVEIGLLIGIQIKKKNLKIIVDGFCASSCANYIFTAGSTKEIRSGMVGFHGNLTASLLLDWKLVSEELRKNQNMTAAQIDEFYKRMLRSSELEQEFLKEVGVDQELFSRTQTADKGKGDGVDYDFLVPAPETFLKYGILNVKGIQDPTYQFELGLNNLYE